MSVDYDPSITSRDVCGIPGIGSASLHIKILNDEPKIDGYLLNPNEERSEWQSWRWALGVSVRR